MNSRHGGRIAGLFTFALAFLCCAAGKAETFIPGKNNFWALDLGVYGSNLPQRYSAPAGYGPLVGRYYGFGRVRRGLNLGRRFFFEPAFGLLLPWRSSVDGSAQVFPMQLSLELSHPLTSFLNFRAGPGVYSELTFTKGSTVSLRNGTSTSDFYMANTPSFSHLFTVEAGFEIKIYRRFSLELEVFVEDVASRLRRRFNLAALVGIRL